MARYRTEKQIIEIALRVAIDSEKSLITSYSDSSHDATAIAHSKTLVEDFRKVLQHRYGHSRSFQEMLDARFESNISIFDVVMTPQGKLKEEKDD